MAKTRLVLTQIYRRSLRKTCINNTLMQKFGQKVSNQQGRRLSDPTRTFEGEGLAQRMLKHKSPTKKPPKTLCNLKNIRYQLSGFAEEWSIQTPDNSYFNNLLCLQLILETINWNCPDNWLHGECVEMNCPDTRSWSCVSWLELSRRMTSATAYYPGTWFRKLSMTREI